ncbi:acyl-CoA dehydrogenase C-terminal domain-containing protein, partial [Nocardia sp. CDC159]
TLTGHLMGAQQDAKELYKVGLGSVRFLLAVGDLLIGWQLLRQAEIALAALDNGSTEPFYQGKVATAQFFARNVLPELTAVRTVLSNLDNDIMELDEAAF